MFYNVLCPSSRNSVVTGKSGKQQWAESSLGASDGAFGQQSSPWMDHCFWWTLALCCGTHAVLVVVFYLLLISSDVQQAGELERLKKKIFLWQMMPLDMFHN